MLKDYLQCCTISQKGLIPMRVLGPIFYRQWSLFWPPCVAYSSDDHSFTWRHFLHWILQLSIPTQHPTHLPSLPHSCLFPSLDHISPLGPLLSVLCYPYSLVGSELSLGGFWPLVRKWPFPTSSLLRTKSTFISACSIFIFPYWHFPSTTTHDQDGTHHIPMKMSSPS